MFKDCQINSKQENHLLKGNKKYLEKNIKLHI